MPLPGGVIVGREFAPKPLLPIDDVVFVGSGAGAPPVELWHIAITQNRIDQKLLLARRPDRWPLKIRLGVDPIADAIDRRKWHRFLALLHFNPRFNVIPKLTAIPKSSWLSDAELGPSELMASRPADKGQIDARHVRVRR